MPLAPLDLIELFTGDRLSAPCYRLHLATAIVQRLEPKTADDLCQRVFPAQDGPAAALELLCAAYDTMRERRGR